MRKIIQDRVLIVIGWCFVLLGALGAVLPLLPTTPFLIVALALFSKSSPRFHQMLLNNKWFGPALQQWETSKTLARKTKYRATVLIVITFAISIFILSGRSPLQLMLVGLMSILLFFIWRIKEEA